MKKSVDEILYKLGNNMIFYTNIQNANRLGRHAYRAYYIPQCIHVEVKWNNKYILIDNETTFSD